MVAKGTKVELKDLGIHIPGLVGSVNCDITLCFEEWHTGEDVAEETLNFLKELVKDEVKT